jgi:prepilin-type N-terminal cleavage/methylation domain-containing protein
MTRQRDRRGEGGFTMIEVIVAAVIMTIAMAGILGLMRVSAAGSGYSRRATEAAILAEDKLEYLRTVPIGTVTDGNDVVDAGGVPAAEGFQRTWTLDVNGTTVALVVVVGWDEPDGAHAITFRTVRSL